MKLLYFAWVRERIGLAEESVEVPAEVATVSDLVGWLRGRGEGYSDAFEAADIVRVAVDRVHARPESPVAGAREVAFFPPMTGG